MERKAVSISMLLILLLCMSVMGFSIQPVEAEPDEVEYWAVLISTVSEEAAYDNKYAYHVLDTHYVFNDINEVPGASKEDFENALGWLNSRSDANDVVFIYFCGHGGGIANEPLPGLEPPWTGEGLLKNFNGIYDENEDEWHNGAHEISEIVLGEDMNNNSVWDDIGVDESLWFGTDWITDDELETLLPTQYGTMIFATQQCMGGGVIDDLSATNRIIITAVDEIHLAIYDYYDIDRFSDWSATIFDALHGQDTSYSMSEGLVHEGDQIDADANHDDKVSILEAFTYSAEYMINNSESTYPQTPWLDDNGNRLPSFYEGYNHNDSSPDNGDLASNTFFPMRYYNLTVRTCDNESVEFNGANVWIDDNSMGGSPTMANVSSGHIWHNVTVDSNFYIGHNNYTFSHWDDNSTSNSRFVHLHSNMTITAYYNKTFINHPPETPSTFSGPVSGYVYEDCDYSASTTDPNGDDIRYEFNWNDSSTTMVPETGYYPSGTQANTSHTWIRPETYQLEVRAQDKTYDEWGEANSTLTVSITQNDANKGVDAGNSFSTATSISPGSYKSTLYESNPTDRKDYYKFDVQDGQSIGVSMTPPGDVNFDLALYDPSGEKKDESTNGPGITDTVSYYADSSGYWRAEIYWKLGEGQCSFSVSVYYAGGCPFVHTWNGSSWMLDNNLIPWAEHSNGTDVTDHYMLQQSLVRDNGEYSLLISETDKHSYIDKVELLAVDHESDVNIGVTPDGEILTYRSPAPPMTATSQNGSNVLDSLTTIDGIYFAGTPDDYIILDFGDLDVSEAAKLLIRADPFCHPWCKTSIHVQVMNSTGWTDVTSYIPRRYWSTDIIDLSAHLPDINDELRVRLYFTGYHKIDYVGLDTSRQEEFRTRHGFLLQAIHSNGTSMRRALRFSDNLYVELLPGEEITLDFWLRRCLPTKQRDFIIILEGHYYTVQR